MAEGISNIALPACNKARYPIGKMVLLSTSLLPGFNTLTRSRPAILDQCDDECFAGMHLQGEQSF